MQHQRTGQTAQLLQLAGPLGLPATAAAILPPMPLTKRLLKGPLISSDRMVNGGQQGIKLIRPSVLHRRASQQPDGPQAGVASETQQRLSALSRHRLAVMGFIHQQQRSGRRQIVGKTRPAQQGERHIKGFRLPSPMAVKPNRCHHHQLQRHRPHQRTGSEQGGESLAQPHLIAKHRTTPGQ